jgi:hypothetical protein
MHAADYNSIEIAQRLNAGCHCTTIDQGALVAELERVSPNFHAEVITTRPHLFSESMVFVGNEHVAKMAALIRAVEEVQSLPTFQTHVLAWAPDIARHPTAPRGVFFGYDFHVQSRSDSTPQLIEINTNAGGALLNAVLARAQQACCLEVQTAIDALLPGALGQRTPEQLFYEMFQAEWTRFVNQRRITSTNWRDRELRCVAIVDEAPTEQFLYPEFVLFQRLFQNHGLDAIVCAPSELEWREEALWYGQKRVDLVYNRLTDFELAQPNNAALAAAYLADGVALTPHPRAHALHADKRNLAVLTDPALLASFGVDAATITCLQEGIPHTELVSAEKADEFWARRRNLFFKPATGYGSKAAYRGDKITRRVFDEVLQGSYVAQALVPPSSRTLQRDGAPVDLKLDLRCYSYAAEIQLIAARLWQGQTTNFRTPGGGFAPVLTMPARVDDAPVAALIA